MPKVLVSGCFDMLHSGHVAFLNEAASYGELWVAIGSDRTVEQLKNRKVMCIEQERLFMVQSLKCVHAAFVSCGSGVLDFANEIEQVQPDLFILNEDGHTPEKQAFIENLGIRYVVLNRLPHGVLPARSTTQLRASKSIPYRIELAGGWLDQPHISSIQAGSVIVASIEPSVPIFVGCGLASSTHNTAEKIWQRRMPTHAPAEELAKMLFACENPPGTVYLSGSQDALGIMLPGINRLAYSGNHWPSQIDSVLDECTLKWLENHVYLLALESRDATIPKFQQNDAAIKQLVRAAEGCWQAICKKDMAMLGQSFHQTLAAQEVLFSGTVTHKLKDWLMQLPTEILGVKYTGAGRGGYLLLVAEKQPANSLPLKLRRWSV